MVNGTGEVSRVVMGNRKGEIDMTDSTLLARIETALNDWTHTYASEMCHPNHVYETRERIRDNGGTLAYVADLLQDVRAARKNAERLAAETAEAVEWAERTAATTQVAPTNHSKARHGEREVVGWVPLQEAPIWVNDRGALVGEYVEGWGWKKVSIWEPTWTRDDIVSRGGTHWWPHLRDLPTPLCAAPVAQSEDMKDALLRSAYDFTKYTAAAFFYDEKGSGTPEWFGYLRDHIEALQPRLEAALNAQVHRSAWPEARHGEREVVGWVPLQEAPIWVNDRGALVGEYVEGWGWKKVSIWEPTWTRDDIVSRGGTHWWPHLRDLPTPLCAARNRMDLGD